MGTFRRRMIMSLNKASRLPSAYQEVEFIGSTGTQYIDTGYYPRANTKIEIKINRQTQTQYSNPYGCDLKLRSDFEFEFYYNLGYKKCRWDRGDSENTVSPQLNENTDYIIVQDDTKCYIDGQLVGTINDTSNKISKAKLALFARNIYGDNAFYGRIYYAKIFYNNTLVRDFIPCYSTTQVSDVDGEEWPSGTIGLYDLVEGEFYTNQGSGTFVKGSDV